MKILIRFQEEQYPFKKYTEVLKTEKNKNKYLCCDVSWPKATDVKLGEKKKLLPTSTTNSSQKKS